MRELPFFLTIDTELDYYGYRKTAHGGANLEKLHELVKYLDGRSIYVTLFVTYNVVKYYADLLRELARSDFVEFGIHLHPEEMPETISDGIKSNSLFDYPLEAVESFLDAFIWLLKEKHFTVPKIFRAGRYRVNRELVAILLKKGIVLDSSVTPYVDWSLGKGPDFSGNPISTSHFHGISEIPISIVLPENVRWNFFYRKYGTTPLFEKPSYLRRLRRIILGREPMWLRPTFSTVEELQRVVSLLRMQGVRYACMMLHSYELSWNSSPQSANRADVDSTYKTLVGFVGVLERLKLVSMPMKSIISC